MPKPVQIHPAPLTAELRGAGVAGAIGTVGDALDNALLESTSRLVASTNRLFEEFRWLKAKESWCVASTVRG